MAPVSTRLQYRKSVIPEGRSGDWAVERFWIRERSPDSDGEEDIRPEWARAEPGEYTRLRLGGVDYMTDLYEEWFSQRVAMEEAVARGGDVLVTGLGLGLLVDTILRCESAIRSVTVLDSSPEVIELVAPHLESRRSNRLSILEADAFSWTPPSGATYDTVWHDIWPNPFLDSSVAESHELIERYAPHADWQGSWALDYRALAGLGS